jgi:hypothetical protein
MTISRDTYVIFFAKFRIHPTRTAKTFVLWVLVIFPSMEMASPCLSAVSPEQPQTMCFSQTLAAYIKNKLAQSAAVGI